MAMPKNLVVVRHGQSEANVVQGMFKTDENAAAPLGFTDRHDTHMRLSPLGVGQARAAGQWLLRNFPDGFDRYYTSPLMRTQETAGAMAINGAWRLDDRWRERDWGEYSALNEAQQKEKYELSYKLRQQHKWFWCAPGGESLATGVRLRFEDILDTMHRESAGKNMIAVTHGEMIDVTRYVLERMDPDSWLVDNKNPLRKVNNCQVLQYTREDPVTKNMADQMQWMRSICPWDESRSWEGGAWIDIPPRQIYSDADLLANVAAHTHLFSGDERLHA